MAEIPSIGLITNSPVKLQSPHIINIDVGQFNQLAELFNFYCYLPDNYECINEDTILESVEILLKYPKFIGVYTDLIISSTGYSFRRYYNNFSTINLTLAPEGIINTPLIVRTKLIFDTNLQELYLYDILLQCYKHAQLWYYKPQADFKYNLPTKNNIANDINYLRIKYGSK